MNNTKHSLKQYVLLSVLVLSGLFSASAAKYAFFFDCDFDFFKLTCTLNDISIQEVTESTTLPHGPEYDTPDIPVLDLSAPIQYRGKEFSITSIYYYYQFKLESLKELTLPANLDNLNPYWFLDCPNLERIKIPDGSTGAYFTRDDGQTLYLMDESYDWLIWVGKELERYELPDGAAINPGALYNTAKLSELIIDSSNPNYSYANNILFTKDFESLIAILPCVETFYASTANPKNCLNEIANYAVSRHSKISHVIMDNEFPSEGYQQMKNCPITRADVISGLVDYAFRDWKKLKEINFETPVTNIPQSFAEGCESLEKVVLPESCKEIWGRAFAECPKLYSVKAPGVKNLRGGVFDSCTNLSSIEFPVLENLREDDFNGTNIDLNDLPETLKYIYRGSIDTRRKMDSYTLSPNIIPNDHQLGAAIVAEIGTFEINHQFPLIGGYINCEPFTVHTLGINCNTLILGEGMKEFNPCIFAEGYRPDKIEIPGLEMIKITYIEQWYTSMDPHVDHGTFVFRDFPQDWRENVTLYVADNLVEKYKADKYWNQLKIYSLSGEYSGVEDLTADSNGLDVEVADGVVTVNGDGGQSVEIYSLDGKRVAAGMTGQPLNVGKGLHIIRCGSAAKKVMVK